MLKLFWIPFMELFNGSLPWPMLTRPKSYAGQRPHFLRKELELMADSRAVDHITDIRITKMYNPIAKLGALYVPFTSEMLSYLPIEDALAVILMPFHYRFRQHTCAIPCLWLSLIHI